MTTQYDTTKLQWESLIRFAKVIGYEYRKSPRGFYKPDPFNRGSIMTPTHVSFAMMQEMHNGPWLGKNGVRSVSWGGYSSKKGSPVVADLLLKKACHDKLVLRTHLQYHKKPKEYKVSCHWVEFNREAKALCIAGAAGWDTKEGLMEVIDE